MTPRFDPLSYPFLFNMPRSCSGVSAWVEHIPFGWLLMQLAKPATLVELGTHYGDSYLAFCQAVLGLNLPTRCWAVDTWVGDKHAGSYGPDVLQWLRSQHDPLYSAFSTLLQQDFDSACDRFPIGQIDVLHIDGLHTYDAVKHDFETWLPKLSRRAVVLLHDTRVRTDDFGVWKVWEEISRGRLSFEFEHGYGLGVLALGPDVSQDLKNFLTFANENAQLIRHFFSGQGHRMEGLRRLTALAELMVTQASALKPLATARGVTRQIPTDFKAAFSQIVPFAESMTKLIEVMARENAQMRQIMLAAKKTQTP